MCLFCIVHFFTDLYKCVFVYLIIYTFIVCLFSIVYSSNWIRNYWLVFLLFVFIDVLLLVMYSRIHCVLFYCFFVFVCLCLVWFYCYIYVVIKLSCCFFMDLCICCLINVCTGLFACLFIYIYIYIYTYAYSYLCNHLFMYLCVLGHVFKYVFMYSLIYSCVPL